jgi:hypothetical protein
MGKPSLELRKKRENSGRRRKATKGMRNNPLWNSVKKRKLGMKARSHS